MDVKVDEGVLLLSAKSGGIGIRVETQNGLAIFRCSGYIDTYNSEDFEKVVKEVIQQGFYNIVFDLAEVNYISSSGVGCFPIFLKLIRPNGGQMVLVAPTQGVLEVLRLLGFAIFFNIQNSMAEALTFFPQKVNSKIIPFEKMIAITDAFGRLEKFTQKEKQPEFYDAIYALLRLVRELQALDVRL